MSAISVLISLPKSDRCAGGLISDSLPVTNLMCGREKRKRMPSYTDIDLTRWKEYDDVRTDSLWILKSRQNTNGHVFDYHGNFIPQIANQIFRRYTREDDIVVDWFLGSGTSAIEAANLNRRLVGVEIKSDLVEYVKGKLPAGVVGDRIRLIQGDSTSETARELVADASDMGADHCQLAVLHPPYADIIKFSD